MSRRKNKQRELWMYRFRASVRLLVGLTVIIGGGFALISRSPELRFDTVVVEGNSILTTSEITDHISAALSGYVAYVIPRDSSFLVRTNRLEASLSGAFSEIADIDIDKTSFRELTVSLEEFRPWNIWCDTNPDDFSVYLKGCYFVDEEGYVFGEAPYFTDRVFVKFYGSFGDLPDDPTGSNIADPETFMFISEVAELFAREGVEPRRIVIRGDGDYEVFTEYIHGLPTQKTTRIFFADGEDPETVRDRLLLAIGTEVFQTDFQARSHELAYIDVRLPDRVFYKMND